MHSWCLLCALFLAKSCHAQNSAWPTTYSGYAIDFLCYDKCVVASDSCSSTCALDRTDVLRDPAQHSLKCIRDVSECFDSRFYLAVNVGTASNQDYRPRFRLDEVGHTNLLRLIGQTERGRGLLVTASGVDNGTETLFDATFVECFGDNCDGVCVGCNARQLPGDIQAYPLKGDSFKRNQLVVGHGTCMIIAWAFLAPTAWLIKRHQDGVNYLTGSMKVRGYPLPFLLHATMMLTAAMLTVVGGGIALITFPKRAAFGHLPIGIIVIAITIFQPFPALFCRPDHDHPRRKYFNWVHKAGGATLLILGPINVFLGAANYRYLWDNCGVAQWNVLAIVGIGGIYVTGAIVFEIGGFFFPPKTKSDPPVVDNLSEVVGMTKSGKSQEYVSVDNPPADSGRIQTGLTKHDLTGRGSE